MKINDFHCSGEVTHPNVPWIPYRRIVFKGWSDIGIPVIDVNVTCLKPSY